MPLVSALWIRYISRRRWWGRAASSEAKWYRTTGDLDSRSENTVGAWMQHLCNARLVGFRGVIINRSVVDSVSGNDKVTLCASAEDYWNAHRQFPDVEFAQQEFRDLPAHEYEGPCWPVPLVRMKASERLCLVDAQGFAPFF